MVSIQQKTVIIIGYQVNLTIFQINVSGVIGVLVFIIGIVNGFKHLSMNVNLGSDFYKIIFFFKCTNVQNS